MSEHDLFKVWFVHLSFIKFLAGYYLMSISYHNVIFGYKYTEYNITASGKCDTRIPIKY